MKLADNMIEIHEIVLLMKNGLSWNQERERRNKYIDTIDHLEDFLL